PPDSRTWPAFSAHDSPGRRGHQAVRSEPWFANADRHLVADGSAKTKPQHPRPPQSTSPPTKLSCAIFPDVRRARGLADRDAFLRLIRNVSSDRSRTL